MSKVLAVISFIDQHGNPVDPGFGGGRPAPGDPGYGIDIHPHPGHDLPGRDHISGGPVWGGRPDNSLPGHGHPDNSLPWNPDVGVWPPDPTDPNWGVGAPRPPSGHFPVYLPDDPAHPSNALPPVHGHVSPPIASTPPGTIWPPLPGKPPAGKAALLIWLVGVGWRYIIVQIPPPTVSGTPTPK